MTCAPQVLILFYTIRKKVRIMIKTIPNGVYPTMVTPYTEDNKIDYKAVKQLIDFYHERGCAGIFAICQSSEIFFLSFEERLELLKFIMANKPDDMAILASGNTADDLETQIKEANAFIETGIDAYVFISNRLAKENEDDDVFLKNLDYAVANLPEISLGIYECPYPYKRLLSPYVLKKMAASGRFQFIKDTCCDIKQIKAKLDAVAGSELKIYNANSATLLESLRLGCAGFSGVMANFHPELYVRLCSIFDKDADKAETLQNFVGFFSVAECQYYPVNAKYYLGLEGLDIRTASRVKDDALFTDNRKAEIDQMHALTHLFKTSILL